MIMQNFTFHNPTELIFGKGQIEKLEEKLNEYGKNILLVYGQGSIKKIGLYDEVIKYLEKTEKNIVELSGIQPNPRLKSVEKGVELCQKHDIDLILAVGGGSTIDASKAISCGFYYEGDLWQMIKEDGELNQSLPLGVILTVAATGSEMNANSVITNWKTKEKLGFHGTVYPSFSILDPGYTYTVSREYTACGIADIASHVFEQYFSHTANTPLIDRWAEDILSILIEESANVMDNPEDYGARANIMLCSTMALNGLVGMGKEEDWASHAIEHEVSAIYDIPHGAGLAIIHPNWMEYVLDEGEEKFAQYARRVFDIDGTDKSEREVALAGIQKTREWFNRMGLPSSLDDYDIRKADLETMAEKAVRDGKIGGYTKLGKEDVLKILEMSFKD